jgi:hypothetical protein
MKDFAVIAGFLSSFPYILNKVRLFSAIQKMKTELFLPVMVKAIPPESFGKMRCVEENLFPKGIFHA